VELTTQIGESVTDGLAYLGALTTLAAGRVFHIRRSFQASRFAAARCIAGHAGRRWGAPHSSLITFFIGLILALQSAYELRKFAP